MMSLLKEAMEEVLNESGDDMEKAEYCFETLSKLYDDAENMTDTLHDLNEARLKRYMVSLNLRDDFDDIMERIASLKEVLDELMNDDLDAVLPGLEQYIDEAEEKEANEEKE